MTNNPYLDMSLDEDLDDEVSPTKSAPNEETKYFTEQHLMSDQIPEEIKSALGNHINVSAYSDARSSMDPELRMTTAMIEFLSGVNSFREDSSMIAAMASILDEMSEGRLRIHYSKFESERLILASHIQLKFARAFILVLTTVEDPPVWADEVIEFVKSYQHLTEFQLEVCVSEYKEACEKLETIPDEMLIHDGIYAQRSFITKVTLGNPPARSDTK